MPNRKNYDIFISYDHDIYDWVEANLVQPLRGYRTKMGAPPRIFFDKSARDGIPTGANYIDTLFRALKNSRRMIPVYSYAYFQREYCCWEFKSALNQFLQGKRQPILPVQLEQPHKLPEYAELIQYITTEEPDWFTHLCRDLELVPVAEQYELEMLDQPGDTQVNRTLPTMRVRIRDSRGNTCVRAEQEVACSSECGKLHGTTRVTSKDGVAVFDDLIVSAPTHQTRLIITGEGFNPVCSELFSVTAASVEVNKSSSTGPKIPAVGNVLFSSSGLALVVCEGSRLDMFAADGGRLLDAPVQMKGKLRFQRAGGPFLALADWRGNFFLLTEDGQIDNWPIGDRSRPMNVAGDVFFRDNDVLLGMWNGEVYRLSPGNPPDRLFRHPDGVQALAAKDDRVYVSDFRGNLCLYTDKRQCGSVLVESRIHSIKAASDVLMVIGSDNLYQVSCDLKEIFHAVAPVSRVAAVARDSESPVIVDAFGKGYWLDAGFKPYNRFHAAAGAVPVSADNHGQYCVLKNLDDSYSLLKRKQIVYSHRGGILSISRDGTKLAVGQRDGIQLVAPSLVKSYT